MSASERVVSPGRVVVVTGAIVGAGCGVLAFVGASALLGQWDAFVEPMVWVVGGAAGAAVGMIAAPLLSWVLLRRVPLGRAIVQTALGTIAGGMIGMLLASGSAAVAAGFFTPFIGGLAGFGVAAARLALRARRERALSAAGSGRADHHGWSSPA